MTDPFAEDGEDGPPEEEEEKEEEEQQQQQQLVDACIEEAVEAGVKAYLTCVARYP